jgi:ATP-dependent exoDNAse (exonuclease V) beta subunit
MTIHKSKGLEFDTVFLPGLGSQANRGTSPMLQWLNLPTQKHGNLLLMSPIQAAHQDQCALYDYLSQLDEIKSSYEAQRLLYVAVTRAKSRLYLMDHSEKVSKNSFRNLLKQHAFSEDTATHLSEEYRLHLPKLTRLPLNYYLNREDDAPEHIINSKMSLSLSTTSLPRLIGIVTHKLLQWICDNHPGPTAEIPWNLALYELRKLGLDEKMQYDALSNIQEQITQLFRDQTGLWIMSKHPKEENEYELLVEQKGKTITRIIDRTFETQGKRWIIDFKTGKEDENSLIKHQQQLNEYGCYLVQRTDLPIHCGIYYLPSNHWLSWQYEEDMVDRD